jgi:hypothetical protein
LSLRFIECLSSSYGGDAKIIVGDRAPDFTLSSQTGGNVTPSSFFGKKECNFIFLSQEQVSRTHKGSMQL